MCFRQSLLENSEKYGVTKAAIEYKINRQYIYRWRRRYNGMLKLLRNQFRRVYCRPNQHTKQYNRSSANINRAIAPSAEAVLERANKIESAVLAFVDGEIPK